MTEKGGMNCGCHIYSPLRLSNTIYLAADHSNDDDAVMLEIEGEKVIKGKNQDETGVLTGI